MTHIDYSDAFDDDSVPESVGMAAARCEGCGDIHVAMLDEDGEPLCVMTLDDADTLRMAMQLLLAVFPTMKTHELVERINIAAGKTDARNH